MKAMYDNAPAKLEAVGNGSWRYRWNIGLADEKDEQKGWTCEEATVWEPLTANKITEAVITEAFAPNYEQKLVNDYNAAALGVATGEDAKAKKARYAAFLEERAKLKAQVDEDCAVIGIE